MRYKADKGFYDVNLSLQARNVSPVACNEMKASAPTRDRRAADSMIENVG